MDSPAYIVKEGQIYSYEDKTVANLRSYFSLVPGMPSENDQA